VQRLRTALLRQVEHPIEVPKFGSFIASGDWTAKEMGLEAFPPENRPPRL
jgi:hypothetical protein